MALQCVYIVADRPIPTRVGEAAHRARPTAPWRRRARAGTGLLGDPGCGALLNGRARRGCVIVGQFGAPGRAFGVRHLGLAYAQMMAVERTRRARAARRRKRRMDRVTHDLNGGQWTALTAAWAGCAYCGEKDKPLQRDRVLALSRGGRYTLSNIVPACRSCNTSKCNDEVTGWLRRKRLDERSFLFRHLEISTALAVGSPPNRRASRRTAPDWSEPWDSGPP